MSASPASYAHGAYPPSAVLSPGQTLRQVLDARRAARQALSLEEAIAIAVPLALDLKDRHARGERLYVHPSSIVGAQDGLACIDPRLATLPTNPRDRACLAPEQQTTMQQGGARSSVFAIGAMLYEAVIGHPVGPGMRMPSAVIPGLPQAFEMLIAKALVADPAHRPDDLGALASAMHSLAPRVSIHPPHADPSRLDHGEGFDVDIRLSMLPVSEMGPAAAPVHAPEYAHQANGHGYPADAYDPSDPFSAIPDASASQGIERQQTTDPTVRLAMLKERLESDPRPRYVVSKDRMDHGPFNAVELLQQITNHTFTSADVLRDELSGQAHPISEWPEFAPFAEQAGFKREIVAEKRAVAHVERAEKNAGIAKVFISIAAVLAIGIVAGVYFYTTVGSRNDEVVVGDDPNALDIELQGGVKGVKRAKAGGHGGGGGGGGGGGMSYEAALSSNVQEINMGAKSGPDLTDSQLHGPMKNASFISGCGAPDSMKVTVKVAIRNGRAAGVSVYTNPPDGRVSSCVDRHVRGLSWPSNAKMDSFVTTY